jgi:cyclohexyl-isocyanide hydratase
MAIKGFVGLSKAHDLPPMKALGKPLHHIQATHWSALDLLPFFGAIPVNERIVTDGNWVFAAGVTAGIDGALRVAAILRGEKVAQVIQLGMAYAPEPPFQSGTPESAPPDVLAEAQHSGRMLAAHRLETARRVATRLGINELPR